MEGISFNDLHKPNKRATPEQMMKYKHAIQMFKLFNDNNMDNNWLDLNVQQNFNDRMTNVHIVDNSNTKVGKNLLVNRLVLINDKIKFDWLNLSLDGFKLKCKNIFLS